MTPRFNPHLLEAFVAVVRLRPQEEDQSQGVALDPSLYAQQARGQRKTFSITITTHQ